MSRNRDSNLLHYECPTCGTPPPSGVYSVHGHKYPRVPDNNFKFEEIHFCCGREYNFINDRYFSEGVAQ